MAVEQALVLESSQIAVEGATIWHRPKFAQCLVWSKITAALCEDQQDFQFCHRLRLGWNYCNACFWPLHMLVYDNSVAISLRFFKNSCFYFVKLRFGQLNLVAIYGQIPGEAQFR
jgi:hypothetical protein